MNVLWVRIWGVFFLIRNICIYIIYLWLRSLIIKLVLEVKEYMDMIEVMLNYIFWVDFFLIFN